MTRAGLSALFAHWRRHPLQLAALLLGLALATALWSGVQAINAEARASYDRAAETLGQGALDRLVSDRGLGMAEFTELRRAGYRVTPLVEGRLEVGGRRLSIRGIDPLTAPPGLGTLAIAGDEEALDGLLSEAGLLLVAPETARALSGAEGLPPLRSSANIAQGEAVTDVVTAQRLLGVETLTALVLAPEQPFGLPPLREATEFAYVEGQSGGDLTRLTESFHLNLTAFGLLSFAVGLFIVQSAIGLAFEQRRQTFRTLRALGMPLARLIWLLAGELTGLALVAGTAGIALGYVIAAALLPGVAGTLRGLYGADVSGQLTFDPLWAVSALAIALAGAGLAGAQALWRVARMPLLAPAQPRAWAMASARTLKAQGALAGLLLLTSAGLALFGQGLVLAFACLAALLIGAALALPPLLIAALRALRPLARGPVTEWLLADARQQVPALSLALMALLLALSANIGVGTMVGSFRTTFTGWLDQRLAAELYLTARTPEEAREIRAFAAPQSDAILPIWSVETQIKGQPTQVFGVADHATYRENWPLLSAAPGVWDRLAAGEGLLINEQLWRREGLALGDPIRVTKGLSLPVAGVYSDYGNPAGQLMVGARTLDAAFPGRPRLRFALRLPPEEAPALAREIRDRFGLPAGNLVNQAEVKALSLRVFEQTFLVTGALNALTLGVAGFAILTSLLTLSTLRLPQLAPIWALGVRPQRLGALEVARTLLLAALTWVLAVPVGLALAWVLLAIVNVEAFGWRLPMRLFPADWLWLGLAALGAAALACLWPVIRLTRLPPNRLLRVFANER
ncbi:ABC transporter permease [Roseivivax sp. GX 12232]|uniref:FtsX-like permease family protein n=1 Tax=Roseivivax sp. GX 12232 TaxID=2900547 RepID=UPI001E4A3CF7|nr:ABC transporter permease [Roseivivax sp. GX 12232]